MDSSDEINQELCSETFRTWLGDPVKGTAETQETRTFTWLLVFDNAEDADVIKKFMPGGHDGSILVTTRHPLLASPELSFTAKTQLKGLPSDDAARLLRFKAQDEKSNDPQAEADAKTIVEWVQGLLMAIDQFGRIMYSERLSISTLKILQDPSKQEQPLLRLHQSGENDRNLVTAWALTDLYERRKDMFALLPLIAMLDAECIEERTLKPRPTSLNSDESSLSHHIANRKHLADTSLIETSRDIQGVSVHRVVQDVMVDIMVRQGFVAMQTLISGMYVTKRTATSSV